MSGLCVLFDLDGTLTDPKPGITRSCAHALQRLGRGAVDPDTLAWCIGPPLRESFGKMLGTTDRDILESAVRHYRERFADIGLFENEVYAGIPETLAALREEGARLFVATSKPGCYAERIVAHFGLDRFFEGVVGSELDGTREPKAEVIAHVLESYAVPAEDAVMVGDRRHDVIGAHSHGIPCVGVAYGYGADGELEEAGAAPICTNPYELVAAVRSRHRSGVMPKTSMS